MKHHKIQLDTFYSLKYLVHEKNLYANEFRKIRFNVLLLCFIPLGIGQNRKLFTLKNVNCYVLKVNTCLFSQHCDCLFNLSLCFQEKIFYVINDLYINKYV